MGNSSRASSSPLDTARRRGRKKKKGRPSLLDLQKRSLRLQKQQQEEQESLKRKRRSSAAPNSNPYLRFPNSASGSARRSTRRSNPNPSTSDRDDDEEEEEEDDENVSRKEKKLRHVLDAAASNSPDRTERAAAANCGAKATDEEDAAEPSEPGPTTPLPDKKLLIFVLDRLQKKDSYGVFSEPVDPEELPDYFDIIDHPMDFGTVRKKLDQGEYASLEQFESDILLICSNAMVYNASDTIYYRQARTIQELAKKDFTNLKAESENSSEHEPKPPAARRGRPPMKKPGRPPAAERVAPDPSTDAGPSGRVSEQQDLLHKQRHKAAAAADPTKGLLGLRILENSNNWSIDHRSERTDDFLGFGIRGGWSKWGPKLSEIDDSKRSTYDHPKPSDSVVQESPIFATFDGERKVLIPVGIHQQHAYSRSLARFAAKLGPTAWKIAAKRIEQALPPGTKFGRGWVGEPELPPHESHNSHNNNLHNPSQTTATSSSPAASSQEPITALTSDSTDIYPKPSLQKGQINHPQLPLLNGFHASLLGNNMSSSQVKNGVGNGNGANRSVSPPDLNVGFLQSPGPGSPRSAGVVGMDKQQQQPDLALQL